MTELQKILADRMVSEEKLTIHIISLIKELEEAQKMNNELGDQVRELEKENHNLTSRLTLAREMYKKIKQENTWLKENLSEI